jgi:hypothetical protein
LTATGYAPKKDPGGEKGTRNVPSDRSRRCCDSCNQLARDLAALAAGRPRRSTPTPTPARHREPHAASNSRATRGPRRSTPPAWRQEGRIAQTVPAGGAGGFGPGGSIVVTIAQHVTGASSDQVPTYAPSCARRGDQVTGRTCCPFPARTPAVLGLRRRPTRLAPNATTGNWHITRRPLWSGCRKAPIRSSAVSRQAHCMKAHPSIDNPVSCRPTARQHELTRAAMAWRPSTPRLAPAPRESAPSNTMSASRDAIVISEILFPNENVNKLRSDRRSMPGHPTRRVVPGGRRS